MPYQAAVLVRSRIMLMYETLLSLFIPIKTLQWFHVTNVKTPQSKKYQKYKNKYPVVSASVPSLILFWQLRAASNSQATFTNNQIMIN